MATAQEPEADRYARMARGIGQGLADLALIIPGVGAKKERSAAKATVQARDQAWTARMSQGIKPATESVTDTLFLLWRVIPTTDDANRS